MNTRTFALALALSGAALPALAQQTTTQPNVRQRRHEHVRRMGPQADGARGGRGIAALVARRRQLGLTDEQVARLQAVQQRTEARVRPLRDQLRALRPEGARRGTLTAEQRQAMRTRAEPIMKQLREQRMAAMQEVRSILTPAQRQQVGTAMRARGAAFRAAARERGSMVQRLVARREQLGLSADQVARLQAIDQQLTQKNAPILARLQAVRPDSAARAAWTAGQPTEAQRQAMQARRQQARPLMEQLRENRRAAMEQARGVLTADQQAKLRAQMRAGRGQRGDRPRGPGRHRPENGAAPRAG